MKRLLGHLTIMSPIWLLMLGYILTAQSKIEALEIVGAIVGIIMFYSFCVLVAMKIVEGK